MLTFKMRINIGEHPLDLGKNSTGADAIKAAKLNPENFLIKRGGRLIPHDEPLKDGDKLELVTVISGG